MAPEFLASLAMTAQGSLALEGLVGLGLGLEVVLVGLGLGFALDFVLVGFGLGLALRGGVEGSVEEMWMSLFE